MNLESIAQTFHVTPEQAEIARDAASRLVGRQLPAEQINREEAICISMALVTLKLTLSDRLAEDLARDTGLPLELLERAKSLLVEESTAIAA
jgi:hypothetical protein